MSTDNLKKINFSTTLKLLREYKKISLPRLGELLNIKYNTIKQYEFNDKIPTINTLIKMSEIFNVSIDYLITETKSRFIKNIKMLSLAENIDKLGANEKYKIEMTVETLINKQLQLHSHNDYSKVLLTNNIHENIKILRENKNLTRQQLSELLEKSPAVASKYEANTKPSVEILIKFSDIFDVSIHYLITGKRLTFNFIDKTFEITILKADQLLPLEYQKFLITLMENIIKQD